MSPPIRRKYHNSVAFATGCKRIKKTKRCNRKIRIPIAMWPCRVEEKMTLKEVDGQTVEEIETKIIAKDGTITRVPGKFQGYETSEEEPVEQPRRHDDLNMNDIEDMLLLAIQHKLFHLTDSDIVDFIVALQIKFKELYTPSHKPPGVIYEDLVKQKRVMRADKLYKFSDGTLKKVWDELHHRVLDFDLGYNKEMSKRKWTATNKKRSELM
ncbi:hypothetical protein Tco_1383688 [Tanacetum coccineum]